MIGHEWVIYLVVGCGCAYISKGGSGQVWACMGKSGQVLMGDTDGAGMGNISEYWCPST